MTIDLANIIRRNHPIRIKRTNLFSSTFGEFEQTQTAH